MRTVACRPQINLGSDAGRAYAVVPLPNISHVFYGRDVGYAVERIDLDLAIENICATERRRKLATAH
jgi:adenylylsulfate kinase